MASTTPRKTVLSPNRRRTGYIVYAYGEKWWHRTWKGAERRAIKCQNHCHNVQIIDCATGDLVSGRPE
jgi:hypothetical protein